MSTVFKWWSSVLHGRRRHQAKLEASVPEENQEVYEVPSPEDFPVFPPSSPQAILQAPSEYWAKVAARKYRAPRGVFEDSSLYALWRLYEFIVLDKVFDYRNALEAFWREPQWTVQDIPDPKDDDPARYAVLAGCTYLLARSFNQRVKLGLKRGMRSLLTPEEAEELKNIPDHLRRYESVPEWAIKVPALATTLVIPTHDGEVLQIQDDTRVDPDFLAKNILLWTPHIYFT
ncbi:hypothetical protein QBC46DRAFT_391138 [Diplogelasinospora grovesii]|uniref:Uncharacterized protein n=1 Tax=Diplogelasinospora grovesii TaxID=303347 RepID=A0AAN6N2J8_9PEZI|nr:hypothetical protein QBC46DRAFT_391138 [Diplogelasinospora grovesii]